MRSTSQPPCVPYLPSHLPQEVAGGCERLLRTPIPLGYTRHTSRFLMLWYAPPAAGAWNGRGGMAAARHAQHRGTLRPPEGPAQVPHLLRPTNQRAPAPPPHHARRLTLLPFSLWESCGFAMIPVAALVAFLLLGEQRLLSLLSPPSDRGALFHAGGLAAPAAPPCTLLLSLHIPRCLPMPALAPCSSHLRRSGGDWSADRGGELEVELLRQWGATACCAHQTRLRRQLCAPPGPAMGTRRRPSILPPSSPLPQPFSILPLEVISNTIEGNIRELQETHGAAASSISPIWDWVTPPPPAKAAAAQPGWANGNGNGDGAAASQLASHVAAAIPVRPSGGGAR